MGRTTKSKPERKVTVSNFEPSALELPVFHLRKSHVKRAGELAADIQNPEFRGRIKGMMEGGANFTPSSSSCRTKSSPATTRVPSPHPLFVAKPFIQCSASGSTTTPTAPLTQEPTTENYMPIALSKYRPKNWDATRKALRHRQKLKDAYKIRHDSVLAQEIIKEADAMTQAGSTTSPTAPFPQEPAEVSLPTATTSLLVSSANENKNESCTADVAADSTTAQRKSKATFEDLDDADDENLSGRALMDDGLPHFELDTHEPKALAIAENDVEDLETTTRTQPAPRILDDESISANFQAHELPPNVLGTGPDVIKNYYQSQQVAAAMRDAQTNLCKLVIELANLHINRAKLEVKHRANVIAATAAGISCPPLQVQVLSTYALQALENVIRQISAELQNKDVPIFVPASLAGATPPNPVVPSDSEEEEESGDEHE
ncbi:hypothetical protein FB45DRAFT_1024026 [Roridomyces roridus]|uniref:Uncharacterized protein n=1 Tax=Roridomyces roridus TaxID=1738132 RepID=A0AAD7C5K7_9AGAR|nr:hypothetical protein FB45DRAFT_1024026 [Roridomyces roridus]